MNQGKRPLIFLVVLLTLVIAGVVWLNLPPQEPVKRPVRETVANARRALENGDFQDALSIAESILAKSEAANPDALMLAGEAASKLDLFNEAIQFYSRVADSAPQAATARWAAGEIYLHLGELSQARRAFELTLAIAPQYAAAHERLIEIYSTVGMRRDAQDHLLFLIKAQRLRPDYLIIFGNIAKQTWTEERLQAMLLKQPEEPLPKLGLARLAIASGDYDSAKTLLETLLAEQPNLIEAHVQRGNLLLESQVADIGQWSTRLPEAAERNPDIWYIRGQFLRRQGEVRDAIRAMARVLELDPIHLPAHQDLAQMLTSVNDFERANELADRAQLLQETNIALERIYKSPGNTELCEELARLSQKTGRMWEAVAWSSVAQAVNPQLTWPPQIVSQVTSQYEITQATPQTIAAFEPSADFAPWMKDVSGLLAGIERASESLQSDRVIGSGEDATSLAQLRFREVAEELGIDFQFDPNSAAKRDGRLIFEITGGGIGVGDFDQDGRQDLYMAQAGTFPPSEDSQTHQDQLFLCQSADETGNAFPVHFTRATQSARLKDFSFSQGVAVGDIDGDGFDDVFVCNIGTNELWLNQGDGTFLPGGDLVADNDDWTVSAAIVDLDLDGDAEIYEVNYVQGEDVFTRTCTVGGKPRGCSPLEFTPMPDRVLTPAEDGHFVAVDGAGQHMVGNGLGVTVFKMDQAETPSVFVAVDQGPNLFGTVVPGDQANANDSRAFTLEDDAILSGIAYDRAGNAQACMGIAAGDANNDGAVDLFVTNFYLEYYTLYLQENGLFRDATAGTSTIAHTTPLLGFGTQFLDAQLDGIADLIVLNGHIDDHTHMGVQEHMPAQFFTGLGEGKFEHQIPEGGFFDELMLGRALALVDFDQDGLMDFAASDLERKAGLIHNESQPAGHSVRLSLVGTQSDRNAFCSLASLRITDGEQTHFQQTHQLVAGNGYEVTNERALMFTIPDSQYARVLAGDAHVDLEIQWANGLVETIQVLELSPRYLAVEGIGVFPN